MLWNLIFNFYVMYIFGGTININGALEYYDSIFISSNVDDISTDTSGLYINMGNNFYDFYSEGNWQVSLGNYLSLIATIITLVIILLVIGHFIKKAFNLFGRII